MRLHAELRRKQSEIQDENCIVTDIIELPESEYASLYQNLLRERDYLAERANMESFIDGQRCCVLVLGKGQEDGILVDSQGSSYARRSAFIPEARTIVRNHIRQLADYANEQGVNIAMEGAFGHVCYNVQRLKQAVDQIDRNNVDVIFDLYNYLDISNASECYQILEEGLQTFGNKIKIFHIKDFVIAENKLKQVGVGKGTLDFARVISTIKQYQPDANLVLEGTTGEDIAFAVQHLKKYV